MNNMNVDYVTLHYRSVLNDFSNQFLNEEFSDCVLNAEGRSLKVHKAMLCAQSSFLEKMILEHQNIGDLCFIIEGVSFDDLKSVVQFMYNGFAKLYKQNFGSFLVVAELLGVKWLDRVQILNEAESSQITNISEPDQVIEPANYETQPIPVFKDLTNCLDTRGMKRKKHMKSKKHCKRSKCTKEDHRNDRKKHKVNHTFRHGDHREKRSSKETHLADMDENTFCTALGLKKNELQSRENFKPDIVCKTDAKHFSRNKTVPPLIKINREIKSTVESYETRDSNMFVSEINTVYIEDKNLSFLNIGANELCIRENNIEIECDVLDASTSQFVIGKEPVANIVELREENIIQAEFVDINPADDDSSSYSDSTTHESVTSAGGLYTETMASSSSSAPPSSTGGLRKSSRPCRKKTCSGFAESTSTTTMVKKSSMTIDKTYLEGSTLFWCDVCQRTYHTKTGLNQHKRYECCKEPAFACPRCDKRFKRKSSLVRHAITLHDEAIFPTRTKLLSKLTGQGDRSILTIAERDLAKAEPNDTDTSAALTLQLDNSDWSISPSSDCSLTDDSILTPVSQSDVESNDTLDDAGTSAVTIIDTETNTVLADIPVDNATIEIHSLDGDTAPGEILEVPENNREVEEEFLAVEVDKIPSTEERGPLGSINSAEKTSPSIYRLRPSVQDHVLTETAESISYQDGIANGLVDIDLSPESPLASFQQSDQCIASKPIEVIALLERDTEIDCGVEPLPDPPAELNSESSPSPVSLSPPPQQLVAPVEAMVDPISGDAPPWITKKKEAVSKAIAEAVKHGSVIIRARGKILRKSSRKKIGPKKHGQRKDCFQEYLEKAFELQPFIIKLDRYKTGSEPNESEKLNFLSNFNLKRNSVFPIYSEHAYTKYNCKSPRRESTSKVRRSNLSNKMKKVNKNPTVVIRKKKPQSLDLNKLNISRTINAVEIERLEESLFTKAIDIQKEHSYNFSEHDCQSFNDFSLRR